MSSASKLYYYKKIIIGSTVTGGVLGSTGAVITASPELLVHDTFYGILYGSFIGVASPVIIPGVLIGSSFLLVCSGFYINDKNKN